MSAVPRGQLLLVTTAMVASALVGVATVAPAPPAVAAPSLSDRTMPRPDKVSAASAAKATGAPIEVSGDTTETRKRWANPDGTFTDEISAGPVRVRAGDAWLPIDTTLHLKDGVVRPKMTVGDVRFSAGNRPDLATVSEGAVSISLGWNGRLSQPTLDGSVATYADVAPGLDIELAARPVGFEQSFIVKDRRGASRAYRLPLALRGVTYAQTSGGGVFRDAARVERAWIGAARMWDRTGARTAPVGIAVVQSAEGPELEVRPDADFMADPAVEFPITIDPTIFIRRWSDTFVDSAAPAVNYGGSAYLKVGKQGMSSLRSFITWDLTDYAGTHITDVYEYLGNWYSASCLAKTTSLYRVKALWTPTGITWNNQPAIDSVALATATSAAGGAAGSGCEGTNWMSFHSAALTAQFDAWANGAANYGHTIRTSETDLLAAKTFLSGEATSWTPRARITYNRHPATVAGRYVTPANMDFNGVRWTSSETPTFAGGSCDPEATDVRVDHELWNSTQTTLVSSSALPTVASCAYSLWTVAAPLANGTYSWRARAFDGTDYSKNWSSWVTTVVDTAAPNPPTVSSSSFPTGPWTGSDGQPGTVTFGPNGSTDVVGYHFGVDDPNVPEYTASTTATVSPSEGAHTLYAVAVDRAGNRSASAMYSFGVGNVGITSPTPGERSQRIFTLSAAVRPDASYLSWSWRRGGDYWQSMSNMRHLDGRPVSGPLWVTNGVAPVVTWDAAATAGVDGPIELLAQVNGQTFLGVTGPPRTVKLDRTDFASVTATAPLGPGAVNLLTGNLQVREVDASLSSGDSDLTVGRTLNTRAGDTGYSPLGPEWRLNVGVPTADSNYAALELVQTPEGSVATVTLSGGDGVTFMGSGTGAWTPEVGAEDLSLSAPTASTYALTDIEGNVTTFAKPAGSARFVPVAVQQAGQPDGATYGYESVPIGEASVTRVTGVMARERNGIDGCTLADPLSVVGCRSLTFSYTATGTPPPAAGTSGRFADRVDAVTFNLFDPVSSSMRSIEVARYAYDSTGRLVEVWDPRLPGLRSTYSYDDVGRLATSTSGGGVQWTITYADPVEPNSGRVRSVSRPTLLAAPAVARWTVVFDVPVTGLGAPHNLSPTELDRTGQQDRPLTGTAIFPPDTTAVLSATGTTQPTSYARATIHYLNRDGRAVNTADPSGAVSTEEYDIAGALVRALSPSNRIRALDRGATPAEEAAISRELSSLMTYSTDGLRVLETFAPERMIRLASTGETVRGRPHVVNTYDEGAPSGGRHNLVTTSVSSVRVAGEATDRSSESRVTKTEYGSTAASWQLGLRTATFSDARGLLQLRLTSLMWDGVPQEGCRHAEEVPAGVQA